MIKKRQQWEDQSTREKIILIHFDTDTTALTTPLISSHIAPTMDASKHRKRKYNGGMPRASMKKNVKEQRYKDKQRVEFSPSLTQFMVNEIKLHSTSYVEEFGKKEKGEEKDVIVIDGCYCY